MLSKVTTLLLFCTLAAGHWENDDKHSAPQPYKFGYEVKDKEGSQYRHEEGDGHGSVKGSYGYTDDKGIYREVEYVADKNGFRAKVKTNEPGTSNQDPADVEYVSNAKHQEVHSLKYSPEPAYHKAAPFQQYKSYNSFHHFSPINSYNYRPLQSFGKHIEGYKYNLPQHGGFHGISNFGNVDGLDNSDEIGKILEELKNKQQYGNDGSFGSFGDFDGFNSDEMKKIAEEFKNKKYDFSGGSKGFKNNDFHIREFRNIGDHKYSRSSDKDW